MATKEKPIINPEIDEEDDDLEVIPAAKPAKKSVAQKEMEDSLTFAVPQKKEDAGGPRVRIFLPRLEDDGSVAVDQYEHVSIANELGENHTRIHRGEWVSVTIPVYMNLKERYGKDI